VACNLDLDFPKEDLRMSGSFLTMFHEIGRKFVC
jgi:hypothetical protein